VLLDHFCLLSLSFLDFDLTTFTISALVNQRATPLVYPTAGGHFCQHLCTRVGRCVLVQGGVLVVLNVEGVWRDREMCSVQDAVCSVCAGPTQRRHQPEPVIDCTYTQRHAHPTQPPASLLVRPHASLPDADLPRAAVYVLRVLPLDPSLTCVCVIVFAWSACSRYS
jgi:hypothetical protein